jgi:hypothetical protein
MISVWGWRGAAIDARAGSSVERPMLRTTTLNAIPPPLVIACLPSN